MQISPFLSALGLVEVGRNRAQKRRFPEALKEHRGCNGESYNLVKHIISELEHCHTCDDAKIEKLDFCSEKPGFEIKKT